MLSVVLFRTSAKNIFPTNMTAFMEIEPQSNSTLGNSTLGNSTLGNGTLGNGTLGNSSAVS
jgi:hypothetical protein